MNKFKISDKVIINKEDDILDVLGDFFDQELEIIDFTEGGVTNLLDNIVFKSIVTGVKNSAHYTWFKKSPQIGDKVKILSHGTESNQDLDCRGDIAIILDVSYLDTFPYRVKIDRSNPPYTFDDYFEDFVKEVEIIKSKNMKPWLKEDFQNIHVVVTPEQSEKLQKYLFTLGISLLTSGNPQNLQCNHLFVTEDFNVEFSENLNFTFLERTILFEDIVFPICKSRTQNITEQLSLSDEAKYLVGEINNSYVNEIMSTHYNNIDKVNTQSSGKTKLDCDYEESWANWSNQKDKLSAPNLITERIHFAGIDPVNYEKQVSNLINYYNTIGLYEETEEGRKKLEDWKLKKETALEKATKHHLETIKPFWEKDTDNPIVTDSTTITEEAKKYFETSTKEMVNHPNHYQSNKIEVIDIIDEFNLGFDLGNTVKYILRSEKKGKQLEDLRKAAWYLNHKIKKLEK